MAALLWASTSCVYHIWTCENISHDYTLMCECVKSSWSNSFKCLNVWKHIWRYFFIHKRNCAWHFLNKWKRFAPIISGVCVWVAQSFAVTKKDLKTISSICSDFCGGSVSIGKKKVLFTWSKCFKHSDMVIYSYSTLDPNLSLYHDYHKKKKKHPRRKHTLSNNPSALGSQCACNMYSIYCSLTGLSGAAYQLLICLGGTQTTPAD